MLISYFFIPATHPKLKEKLKSIQANHFIIDLEDAIKESDLQKAIEVISSLENPETVYLRPPLFRSGTLDGELFENLLLLGFRKFLIPKFRSINHIHELEDCQLRILNEPISHILVIENSESLLCMHDIFKSTALRIEGIGFGSQDYCAETGLKHESEYLNHARFMIAATAKANGVNAIDIACMQIHDQEKIKSEIHDAFNFGFEAKFFIHPIQLEVLKSINFFTTDEIEYANSVLNYYHLNGKPAVFSYEGMVIEPPHIMQFQRIKKWSEQYGNK